MTTPAAVTRMQQKRANAADWAAVNPVLEDGEIGFARDTGEVRIGNGVTNWNNLVPILKSVLSPTSEEWETQNPVLLQGQVGIARDTEVIKIGDGFSTWNELPAMFGSTFISKEFVEDNYVAKADTVLNVKDFGAVLDGVANDTAALIACLTAAGQASGITGVEVPRGILKYDPIFINAGDGIHVYGSGILRSTAAVGGSAVAFWLLGSDITLEGLTFDHTTQINIDVDSFNRGANDKTIRLGGQRHLTPTTPVWHSNIRVINCTIRDARNTGIDIYYADKVVVSGNTIERSLGNGIFVTNCLTDLRIVNNSIQFVADDGIFIACDAHRTALTQGVVISGNTIEKGYAKGIGMSGIDGGVITGNDIRTTFAPGIQVIQDAGLLNNRRILIVGNNIDKAGTNFGVGQYKTTAAPNSNGIEITSNPTDIDVVDNSITEARAIGINITSGQGVRILRNRIRSTGGLAINAGQLTDTTFNTIQGLVIAQNDTALTVSGILVGGSRRVVIANNTIRSFKNGSAGETRAIYLGNLSESKIHDNHVVNDDGANFGLRHTFTNSTFPQTRWWNNPTLVPGATLPSGSMLVLERTILYSIGAPTTGTFVRGDVCFETNPVASGFVGYVCTVGGTPGTWKTFGPISA